MDAFLEERIAAGHRFVVAPILGRFQPLDDAAEVTEDHFTDRAIGKQLSKLDGKRLVVIVLAHQHDPLRAIARLAYRPHSRRSSDTRAFRPARACPPTAPAA